MSNKSAQKIALFIEKQFGGVVDPKTLVAAARPTKSPIHRYFEWNNTRAAEKYRLWQARNILLSIEVIINEKESVRAYHNIFMANDDRTYVSLDRARQSEDLWEQIIHNAMREALAWNSRYETYKELSKISKSIKHTHKTLERKKKA